MDILQRREGDLAVLAVLDGFDFVAVLIQQDEAEFAFLQLAASQGLGAREGDVARRFVGVDKTRLMQHARRNITGIAGEF